MRKPPLAPYCRHALATRGRSSREEAPFFIRPFIRSRAEKEAGRRGLSEVTTALLDELKASEHKSGQPQ
jgi:hypothetical protein